MAHALGEAAPGHDVGRNHDDHNHNIRRDEGHHSIPAAVPLGDLPGMSDATTLPTARVIVIAIVAVGWRLLTVPFCRGFAGIEALNAFLAVKSQYFLFSTGSDNPFERAGPENNV